MTVVGRIMVTAIVIIMFIMSIIMVLVMDIMH